MKHLLAKSAATLLTLMVSCIAQAETITFDDVPSSRFEYISSPYHSYTFNYWEAVNGAGYGPSGYKNGIVSGSNSACGCASDFTRPFTSISSAGPFTLGSGYFTSAWNDGATLVVTGLNGGNVLFTSSALLDTTGPSLLTFGWGGLDEVRFAISGGTPSGLPGAGNYFALDNLVITSGVPSVPEPSTWAMMMIGFGAAGYAMRRRRVSYLPAQIA